MSDVHVLAIDLAKRSFQVCATDRGGAVLFNRTTSRGATSAGSRCPSGSRASPMCATSSASTSVPSPPSTRLRYARSRRGASSPMARRFCSWARLAWARPIWPSPSGGEAIVTGYSVLFTPATTLVAQLAKAHGEGRLEERLTHYAKPKLLIVDELGYLPFEPDAAHLFFQLVSRRYERGAMLVTSNRAVGEWGSVFGEPNVSWCRPS